MRTIKTYFKGAPFYNAFIGIWVSREEQPCVLIGGLGMGFTLRATLDFLPPDGRVVVAELVPAVVEWNRGPLGPLAGHPLNDKRVRIEMGDVAVTLRSGPGKFDAVLLDVDNGPTAFTESANAWLYDDRGIAAAHAALKMAGVLAVWSARDDPKFEKRLRYGGFAVQTERVRGRLKRAALATLSFWVTKLHRVEEDRTHMFSYTETVAGYFPRMPRLSGGTTAGAGNGCCE